MTVSIYENILVYEKLKLSEFIGTISPIKLITVVFTKILHVIQPFTSKIIK
jgi:hypothetical protein